MVSQLDLSRNKLCVGGNSGGWISCAAGGWTQAAYTAEGITAIADALRINRSLTEVELRRNQLGSQGWCSIFDALAKNTTSKITKWDLSSSWSKDPKYESENIGPQGAKSMEAYLGVCSSLTQVLVF